MRESLPKTDEEKLKHQSRLSDTEEVEVQALLLRAAAQANQTLDNSPPVQYVPSPDPSQILDFGRPIVKQKAAELLQTSNNSKKWRLRKSLQRAKITQTR